MGVLTSVIHGKEYYKDHLWGDNSSNPRKLREVEKQVRNITYEVVTKYTIKRENFMAVGEGIVKTILEGIDEGEIREFEDSRGESLAERMAYDIEEKYLSWAEVFMYSSRGFIKDYKDYVMICEMSMDKYKNYALNRLSFIDVLYALMVFLFEGYRLFPGDSGRITLKLVNKICNRQERMLTFRILLMILPDLYI